MDNYIQITPVEITNETGRVDYTLPVDTILPDNTPPYGGYGWHGRRDSNPQPAVLETAALPIEPRPFAGYTSIVASATRYVNTVSRRIYDRLGIFKKGQLIADPRLVKIVPALTYFPVRLPSQYRQR